MRFGRDKVIAFASIVWLALATGPVQANEETQSNLSCPEGKSISNFSRVTPNIWRGSNPDDHEIEMLHRMGVKSIINLRMSGRGVRHEREVSEKYGIKHFHIPFGYLRASDKKIEEALSIMTDRENQPVYIHCLHGADRTGMIIGVYRSLIQDWSFNRTYREMRSHHFKPWFGSFKSKVKHCSQNKPLVAAREEIKQEKKRRVADRSSSNGISM